MVVILRSFIRSVPLLFRLVGIRCARLVSRTFRDFFLYNYETYLSKRTFSTLQYKVPLLVRDTRIAKYLSFNKAVWCITSEGVEMSPLDSMQGSIWKSSLIDANPEYIGPMFNVSQITAETSNNATGDWKTIYAANIGRYTIELTEKGKSCVFLQFLSNTSNFYWAKYELALKEKIEELDKEFPAMPMPELQELAEKFLQENSPYTAEEEFETQQHLIAKITSVGHLMHKHRSPDRDYWIYGMEGNLIEDQKSQGRSGKSLIARLLSYFLPVAYVDGKKDLTRDIYAWDKVTPETAFVNIDDAERGKVKVTDLFSRQTAAFGVRGMNKAEIQIPYEDAPIGYMTSNFNLLDNDDSTRDRWRVIAFSDFYSAERKPEDIHGHLFYYEWDDKEKERFFSSLADCVKTNFLLGGVKEASNDRVDARRWLQEIGPIFKEWADSQFLMPTENQGLALHTGPTKKYDKREVLGTEGTLDWSFLAKHPKQRQYMTETKFKRKLWIWCLLNGYIINPGKSTKLKMLAEFKDLDYGGDDKTRGKEWITIMEEAQKDGEAPEDNSGTGNSPEPTTDQPLVIPTKLDDDDPDNELPF